MGRAKRGNWEATDTRRILLQAAWECFYPGFDRSAFVVSDVLRRASEIWAERYGLSPGREFTRGAITTTWPTIDEFLDAAIANELGDEGAATWPPLAQFDHSVRIARDYATPDLRRDEIKLAMGSLIYTTVLNAGAQTWVNDLRFQLLARRDTERLAALFERADVNRRTAMSLAYTKAFRLTNWDAKPAKVAQAHLALIDGSLLQLSINPTLSLHQLSSDAQDTVLLMCDGLTVIKTPTTKRNRVRRRGPQGIDTSGASIIPPAAREVEAQDSSPSLDKSTTDDLSAEF